MNRWQVPVFQVLWAQPTQLRQFYLCVRACVRACFTSCWAGSRLFSGGRCVFGCFVILSGSCGHSQVGSGHGRSRSIHVFLFFICLFVVVVVVLLLLLFWFACSCFVLLLLFFRAKSSTDVMVHCGPFDLGFPCPNSQSHYGSTLTHKVIVERFLIRHEKATQIFGCNK